MRKLIKYYWPIMGLVFMLIVVIYYIVTADKKMIKKTKAIGHLLPSYALQLKDVHYRRDDPDKDIKWELDAKNVKFSKDKSVITFYDFHLKLHSKGKKGFELKGKKGKYVKSKNTLYLRGNLEAIYGMGYKLFIESIVFNEKNGQGISEDPVKIVGPFFIVNGKGLFLDLKQKKIKVLSDVNSVIKRTLQL